MRNTYLPYLPIQSEKSARLLEKEAVWTVFNHIRKGGLDGKTVKEISQELNEPVSTVYGAVEALEREGYVRGIKLSKIKKWGRQPKEDANQQKGKMARKYFESCEFKAGLAHRGEGEKESPWGDVIFSPDFYNQVGAVIKNQPELKELHENLIKFAEKFCKEKVAEGLNGDSKRILPSTEKCVDCGKSHEGYEFTKAILLYIATEAVDSGNFKNLLKELGYST